MSGELPGICGTCGHNFDWPPQSKAELARVRRANRRRAKTGQAVLDYFANEHGGDRHPDGRPHNLVDVLADLMHLVGPEQFDDAARIARGHYELELKGRE